MNISALGAVASSLDKPRVARRFWLVCKRCADELGYEEDAPKWATEGGLKRHLKLVHNGATSNDRERFTL